MFSDEVLFDNVSFNVDENDKIGFVGVNGAGKSTLFKIIINGLSYDEGEFFKNKSTKIGYLEQYACSDSDNTVMEEILTVFSEVIDIEQELDGIRFDIENKIGDLDSLVTRQHIISDRFAQLEGFFYKSKIRSSLLGLGFTEDDFNLKVSRLSGGQKTRISLCKILLSDANLLLLDEPTNHLDIQSVEWLEDFLRTYKGAFIVISHDRYFLDRVTNKTFELENTKFYSFNGNYSFYVIQKEIDKKTEERKYENTKKEISRLEGIVEQQRRWNREKNIKTAESKIKVIQRLEKDLTEPKDSIENMFYNFKSCGGGGNDVLITENLSKSFDDNKLFEDVNIHIVKGEKIFLLGPNGCGKTTLLKILMGIYEPTKGTYKIGSNIHIGYYDQIQENLSMDKTVIDEVWDTYPDMTQTQIRNALAMFLFKGEDVFKEINKLSGGERSRVELVKLILKKVNFLILDEPTNHLDIESRESLENALAEYDGTMLIVSHDRYFINKLSTRILHLEKQGIDSYGGNYDYYLEKLKDVQQTQQKIVSSDNDYKEQKRISSEKRKILNKFTKIEDEISKIEEKIKEKTKQLEKPAIASDYVKATEITNEIEKMNENLQKLYQDWEEIQLIIEENGYIL